jgi:hypothetical protein
MKNMHILFLLGSVACGRDATEADYKLAGVGLNPEEISPTPTDYGGIASYDYIEFSGAALSLGLMGLLSFDSSGPTTNTFEPPYGLVYGSTFFFESAVPAPDALFGSFASGPDKIGHCHTVFEPRSYLSGIADAGTSVDFVSANGEGFSIGRRPLAYPPDASKVFPYYSDLAGYRASPRVWRNPSAKDTTDLKTWQEEDVGRPNFPFGEQVSFSFKGAIPAAEATFGSIPQPFDSGEIHPLPSKSNGVLLSWVGPQFSGDGIQLSDEGENSVCMQYASSGETPENPADCIDYITIEPPKEGQFDRGRMYTGPWDTEGGVLVKWIPSASGIDEKISISVRFLGDVDEGYDPFVEEVVIMDKNSDVQAAWDAAIRSGTIPEGAECPETGSRPALPCDEDIAFEFDPALRRGDGYIPSMQGDPLSTLAETTCTVDDVAGEFLISEEVLEQALSYARQHKAKGAIFYINRTTKTVLDIPPARDSYGSKKEAGEMLIVSNAVQIGRFWVQPGTFE